MADYTPINFTLTSTEIGTISSSTQRSGSNDQLQLRGALIMLPFALFVVLANILTILAFLVEKRLRVFYNYFVVNMAVADALIGITAMGSSMVQFLFSFQWPFDHVSCSILMALSHVSMQVSILMVLVICIDRWYAVHRPLKHICVRRRCVALKVNASVWLIALVIWGPFMGIWALLDPFSQTAAACSPVYLRLPLATFGAVLMVYWLPVTMIAIIYVSLYRKILKSGGANVSRNFEKQMKSESSGSQTIFAITAAKSMKSERNAAAVTNHETREKTLNEPPPNEVVTSHNSTEDEKKDGSKRNKEERGRDVTTNPGTKPKTGQDKRSSAKAQRTLTLLVVVLVITWTPCACVVVSRTYCYDVIQLENCFSPFISVISVWVTWGNSLLNPIMYAAAQPLFRKTIFKLLVGKCTRK